MQQKQQLKTELKQTLRLNASMQQSINVLQMSSIDLQQSIEAELAQNPFLEVSESDNDPNNISSNYNTTSNATGSSTEAYDFSNITAEKSLQQHINEQISLDITDPIERAIALYISDSLQPTGYITIDISQIAKHLKCNENDVLICLKKLQSLDPTGVFARSLKECLEIQLIEKKLYNDQFKILLEHLDLIAKYETKQLAKLCNVSINEIISMINIIKSLNPKPGINFTSELIKYKIPDVILSIDENQEIHVEINYDVMSKLNINKEYYIKIKNNLSSDEKEFASSHMTSATNLIKAVEQRAKTLVTVAAAIATRQSDFFLRGVMYFKSITLSDIAKDCNMNESTISRATSHKYISTPLGLFEMKFFFSSHVENKNNDDDVSSIKVKELIKSIINAEDPKNILSDDEIASELLKFNIRIARRTVSKYREALQIPTSATRKRVARLNED